MALSMIYGEAIEISGPIDGTVRLYELDGRTFLGTDTYEIVHVCGNVCRDDLVQSEGDRWTQTDNSNRDEFVSLTELVDTSGEPTGKFDTLDVQGFDRGDDPFVLCAACGAELYRDDEAFEEMFDHPIDD